MILFGILKFIFRGEIRFRYPTWIHFLFHVGSAYLALLVLWFTSQAIGGLIKDDSIWGARNYFEFLLLGEMVVLLPIAIIESSLKAVRYAAHEGFLEDFFLHPAGVQVPLFSFSLSLLTFPLIHFALSLSLAYVIFDFSLDLQSLAWIVMLILASAPMFAGIGMMAAAFFLRTGRGEGLLNQILYVASVFAGVYFPLTVLPEFWRNILDIVSPLTVLMATTREIAAGRTIQVLYPTLSLFILSVVLFFVGWCALIFSDQQSRKKGLPPFSHP